MDGYEKLIKRMRAEGSVNNPASVMLGVMTGPNSCKVGGLILNAEDLLIIEPAKTGYMITDTQRSKPIGAGDTVAIYRVTEDKFLILGKAV